MCQEMEATSPSDLDKLFIHCGKFSRLPLTQVQLLAFFFLTNVINCIIRLLNKIPFVFCFYGNQVSSLASTIVSCSCPIFLSPPKMCTNGFQNKDLGIMIMMIISMQLM